MRRILGVAAATVLVGAVGLFAAVRWGQRPARAPNRATGDAQPALAHVEPTPRDEVVREPARPVLAGLDLTRLESDDAGMFARLGDGAARLTLDAGLQGAAARLLAGHHVPEGAVVAIDVATGRLLAYASHVEPGPPRDICVEARAPSASVFKIVTAAALVEKAHVSADTRECYAGGGEQRITLADLAADPRKDHVCTTLGGAMGHSVNTVFARLALGELTPPELEAMARRLGYGEPIDFDVSVQPSELHLPSEPLEFARTAAGFWSTTLSPLEAALLSATIARGGESVRPTLVDRVVDASGAVTWKAPEAIPGRRAVARETAEEVTAMMEHTVRAGTCSRAFHDERGLPFLPGVRVAAKTGTLTDGAAQRYYSWFTGFAPVGAAPSIPQVAVAVLVVNGPAWAVKANVIGRDVLRAYFAAHGAPGVSPPNAPAVARRGHAR